MLILYNVKSYLPLLTFLWEAFTTKIKSMRKIWKLLPHFIVEWIAANYGEVIELQNQRWYVISYKKNLGNTFVVRNKEVEQSKSWDDSEYYDESPCGDAVKHNFSVMKIGICYACKRIRDSS